MPRPRVPLDLSEIARLREQGLGLGRIARMFRVSKATIFRRLREFREAGAAPMAQIAEVNLRAKDALDRCHEPRRRRSSDEPRSVIGTDSEPMARIEEPTIGPPPGIVRASGPAAKHATAKARTGAADSKRRRRKRATWLDPAEAQADRDLAAIAEDMASVFDELDQDEDEWALWPVAHARTKRVPRRRTRGQ